MPDSAFANGDSLIVDMVRRFAQERLAPHAADRARAAAIEPEIVRELGELGILGATTPVAWGGSEIDAV
ncbi:MAG: acyl-CoA dehydrogenase family protein, partial [Rhodospirillales bacterium]|nr:acyl-CoA dehydrogenase family protein [Rhodospirillales bacterium]